MGGRSRNAIRNTRTHLAVSDRRVEHRVASKDAHEAIEIHAPRERPRDVRRYLAPRAGVDGSSLQARVLVDARPPRRRTSSHQLRPRHIRDAVLVCVSGDVWVQLLQRWDDGGIAACTPRENFGTLQREGFDGVVSIVPNVGDGATPAASALQRVGAPTSFHPPFALPERLWLFSPSELTPLRQKGTHGWLWGSARYLPSRRRAGWCHGVRKSPNPKPRPRRHRPKLPRVRKGRACPPARARRGEMGSSSDAITLI